MPRGGFRQGSGRPEGSGTRYPGEATRTIRVPDGAVPAITTFLSDYRLRLLAAKIVAEPVALEPPPLLITEASVRVPAGSAVPNDSGEVDLGVDLNRMLVRKPAVTYIVPVESDSMTKAGIEPGDKLIVECGLEARHGDIVIAIILGEGHTLKRFSTKGPRPQLAPESHNPVHQVRELGEFDEWMIWAVVTSQIRRLR